jgi:hypothetical protein
VEPVNEPDGETIDMAYLLSASVGAVDAHDDKPAAQPHSAATLVDEASTEVLITEQEVLFWTAVAVRAQRRKGRRSQRMARQRRDDRPARYEFLERALTAREMGRL